MLTSLIACGSPWLAIVLAVVPTIDHPVRSPSPRTASPSATVARLGLADGSTVCGRLTSLPAAGVLIVAGTTVEQRSTLDLVSVSFVNEVTLLEPGSAEAKAGESCGLREPIRATVTLGNRTQIDGQLQQASTAGVVVLADGASEPTIVPSQALAHLRLLGAAATPKDPSDATDGASSAAPAPVSITLRDGTSLRGRAWFDPASQCLALSSVTKEGTRTIEFLSSALIQAVAPAGGDEAAANSSEPLRSPLRVSLLRLDGTQLQGGWQQSPLPGFVAVLADRAETATLVPLHTLGRITLSESAASAARE
jgi:hypothetical protein